MRFQLRVLAWQLNRKEYEMPKLKSMKVKAVALVDKGANRRDFFLIKSFKGGNVVKKELAIEILKSAKDLSQENVDALVALVPENDRAEVLTLAKAADGLDVSEDIEIEQLLEKVSKTFAKSTSDQMKGMQDGLSKMQTLLEELLNGLKADDSSSTEDVPVELQCACGEKVTKAAGDNSETVCPKCGEVIAPVVKTAEGSASADEISEEQFNKMLEEKLSEVK
jgi:hypothetical protein